MAPDLGSSGRVSGMPVPRPGTGRQEVFDRVLAP